MLDNQAPKIIFGLRVNLPLLQNQTGNDRWEYNFEGFASKDKHIAGVVYCTFHFLSKLDNWGCAQCIVSMFH